MESTTLPAAEQAALNAAAAKALGLVDVEIKTVLARPISFAEVQAAMEGSDIEPFEFDGYLADEAGLLRPRRFKVKKSRNRNEPFEPQFAPIPNPRPNGPDIVADRDHVVGHLVRLEAKDPRGGGGTSEVLLYTSSEAEESASLLSGRSRVGLDSGRVFMADPEGRPAPLMPIYGSQATVSFIVADMSPEEVAERTQRALEAEFGDALGKNRKVRTREVANRRVDVSRYPEDQPLAIGILADEVSLIMENAGSAVTTTTHKPGSGVVFGS